MNSKQAQLPLEQARLPLKQEDTMTDQGPRTSLKDTPKALDKACKAFKAVVSVKPEETLKDTLALHNKAIAALQAIGLEDVLCILEKECAELVRRREDAFKDRREVLLRSAEEARWTVKRLKNYDFVGCFRVNYKKERVTILLGSELLSTVDEVDGKRLFAHLQSERKNLDEFPFERLNFFQSMKEALTLARAQGQDQDGKVPIRKLYPLMVIVRQSQNEHFLKSPGSKSFTDYPMAQFLYDLARFGQEGWKVDGRWRLSTQTPNMASVAKRVTVKLPTLHGDGSRGGEQLGMIWIQKI